MPQIHTFHIHSFGRVKTALALACGLFVSACYVSETSLIADGEAVLPIDQAITVCMESSKPCFEMSIQGDGYVKAYVSEDDGAGTLRFTPLTQAANRQVFIAEAKADEDPGFTYILARRAQSTEESDSSFQFAAITCGDLTGEQEDAFIAAGGEVSGGFVSSCRTPDLMTLKATLLSTYGEELAYDDWWLDNGPD